METFKKPLSREEEAGYIRMLSGTPEEAARARQVLIERNLRLVAHIVKKYQTHEDENEDYISIGCIGLIKAVNTFDEGKGRLATYACRCIENELLMFLRGKKKFSREVSLYESIGQDKEGNEIRLMDVLEQEQPDIIECMELRRKIEQLLALVDSVLSKREREILMMRYGLKGCSRLTQNEIAQSLGISRSYVSRIEKKALQKLKAQMQE